MSLRPGGAPHLNYLWNLAVLYSSFSWSQEKLIFSNQTSASKVTGV